MSTINISNNRIIALRWEVKQVACREHLRLELNISWWFILDPPWNVIWFALILYRSQHFGYHRSGNYWNWKPSRARGNYIVQIWVAERDVWGKFKENWNSISKYNVMANIFCPVCHIVSISQMRRYNLQKGRLLYFILTGEKLGYFENWPLSVK